MASAVLDVVAPSSRAADALSGVIDGLREATGLLVLDGCDVRLAEAQALATAVLRHCATVRVLATSQERLGERDEALASVSSLPPEEAVALLADRARLADPRFTIPPGDMPVAMRLCDLVDRLPLGIELVARHLNALHLSEMVARGRGGSAALGGRHGRHHIGSLGRAGCKRVRGWVLTSDECSSRWP